MSRNTRSATQCPGRAGLCDSRLPTPSTGECDQIVISRLSPNSSSSVEMVIYQVFRSAPGATRTPNLLIRRSPSGAHGRPYPSIHGSAVGFRFHQCPLTTAAVHPEWLPTWLPARALPAMCQQRHWLPRRPTYRAERWLGAQNADRARVVQPDWWMAGARYALAESWVGRTRCQERDRFWLSGGLEMSLSDPAGVSTGS